ncbi:TauD/TfdA family dioxygenase [Streptomyces sp. XD-27]|uniref:TauD/TfdA dioxygenase family protein n=1 Tax=Streptomyces sp. XD-27 TaxID=3062779 RepID=UPI0026F42FD1|nr:TauD/TfdA family dioxygenase [Streptomyces sp. XD-27]WKX73085.1 TauD/TfdA family dioxygenase [Streptomyces sp. XD-27]
MTTTSQDTGRISGHPHRLMEPFGIRVDAGRPGAPLAELPVAALRELARRHHLLLLRGFGGPASAAELTAYCEGWGEIGMWPFGAVLELVEHEDPADHIFDHRYVPLHWDGMYRSQVPEFQIFHCVAAPGTGDGGRTTFTQTAAVLREADPADRARWERVTGRYRRAMEFYDSEAVSPVVTRHPDRGFPVIRYNEPVPPGTPFLNHPDLEFTGLPAAELAEFHRSLQAALHAPRHLYAHTWHSGDLVIADNHTLLHGREEFTSRAPRHLRRVHILGSPPLDNPALIR